MKEHPILFSGQMVRAILDGRKTQTRRVVKNQPGEFIEDCYARPDGRFIWLHLPKGAGVGMGPAFNCPYGVPGDRLWVRETWGMVTKGFGFNAYDEPVFREGYDGDEKVRWHPSIHMPRSACRIVLEIACVRVERLQKISYVDAKAEGVEDPEFMPRLGFMQLWDSINAKRGFGWEANPWVWVIEFRRVNNASA